MNTTDLAANKRRLAAFLNELSEANGAGIESVLDAHCAPDTVWRVFHPFNDLKGNAEAADKLWAPLREAFPDWEARMAFFLGGEYEGRECVSSWGVLMGNLTKPWLSIPATHGLCALRLGLNVVFREGRIVKVYVLLDIPDLMRQAGVYPFRRMPGSAEAWAFPPCDSGATAESVDHELGAITLTHVREMQTGLAKGDDLKNLAGTRSKHSPHWHKNMMWYGPAGIGSSRGQKGFLDFHGALFIQAFPDREGIVRDHNGPEDGPGHYIRVGDGHYAVTAGWPSLYGTHLGGQWLGMAPSGKRVEMRVADWYRTDRDGKIIDNWVMIDVLHILHQAGLDVLDDLRYIADPSLNRWPG
ncbi:ester cyclase [Roseateles violae]|uniref:Ester cyclase n=1 Tax=Roseateles violae TaxID=3058042 RepID=A0ABT8DLT7_9BURK|nr:ester cyclase [Pelomonas sp. PFR6]MDN3919385.1 ester cyclase [Pelomonas sp. PFR6]